MSNLLAINDDVAVYFSGEYTSKRGLMRIANRAVRQAYQGEGKVPPSNLSFDLFTGYNYSTACSYSPIEFDGDYVVALDFCATAEERGRDMTEVDVALYLASHGPGLYRVYRSGNEPDESRLGFLRLNTWDGEDPAARAHDLMGRDSMAPHIIKMQFISSRFGWDNGRNRVCPKPDLIERDGLTYSREWWEANHYTCRCCGQVFARDGEDRQVLISNPSGLPGLTYSNLRTVRYCPTCAGLPNVVEEATSGGLVDTANVSPGTLSDFHGRKVFTHKLDQCGVCDSCGQISTSIYRRGLHAYCETCVPHDLMGYHHTYATEFYETSEDDGGSGLFLGVELETCAPGFREDWASTAHDIAELCTGNRGFVETKKDSSLDEGGVEIVTMPATPLYHLTNSYWGDLLSYGASKGVETPRCCGLHVHVSRDFFNDRHYRSEEQVTIDRFVSRFTEEWKKFSGRESFYWCKLHSDDSMGIYPEDCDRRKRKITKDNLGAGHCTAVNHEGGNPTVEFRFFAGTMDLSQLRASLECAAGLAIMAKALNLSGHLMETWTFDEVKFELVHALKANGIPYEDFQDRCKKVGI